MMHGPINIRYTVLLEQNFGMENIYQNAFMYWNEHLNLGQPIGRSQYFVRKLLVLA